MPYETELAASKYLVSAFAGLTKKLIPDLFEERNELEVLLSLRVLRTSNSVLRLLIRDNASQSELHPHADLASVAALARMVIETSINFFFLCADQVSASEREFRRLASMLHYGVEMLKLSREFGIEEDLVTHEQEVRALRERLASHPVATQRPLEERNRALSGAHVIFMHRSQLAQRMGLPTKRLGAIYRVFSGYAHSNALSLHLDRTRCTEPSAQTLEASSILFHVNTFLAKHGLYLLDLFPDRDLECPDNYLAFATGIACRSWGDA